MIRAHTHFGKSDRDRIEEWHRHQRRLTLTRQDEQRKQQEADDAADADLIAVATTLATSEQIADFTVRMNEFDQRLDGYHEASVEALIEANANLESVREHLKRVRRELDVMRQDAFELEDGTRIFLSEDETWAMDIEGNDIDIEDVPVDLISPEAKIADEYSRKLSAEDALISKETKIERNIEAIHRFDHKRAEAAERSGEIRTGLENGEVTSDELQALESQLEAMDAELLEIIPPSVRARVNGVTPDDMPQKLKSEFNDQAGGLAPEARSMSPLSQPASSDLVRP